MEEKREKIEKPINQKQETFCIEYLRTNNAYAAARYAGFSPSYAGTLLTKGTIKKRLEELRGKIEISDLVSIEYVVSGLVEVFERCLAKKPKMGYNKTKRCSEQEKDEEGRPVWSFDASGANKALELLGRYVGLFSQDNAQRVPSPNKSSGNLSDAQFADLLKNLAPTIINEKIEISTKPKKEKANSEIN